MSATGEHEPDTMASPPEYIVPIDPNAVEPPVKGLGLPDVSPFATLLRSMADRAEDRLSRRLQAKQTDLTPPPPVIEISPPPIDQL